MENGKLLAQHVRSVDICFEDLGYQVTVPKQKEKKRVLKGITGIFKSGEMTAIMGPSGAGKSSLMNILTGLTTKGVTGKITVGKARKLCAYIMQDDHFYSWFTVEETMLLATALKISKKCIKLKEKQLLIEQLLNTLKLAKARSTRCSNLSGGQKKRLSIALELIDNPAVLFLDEPTTGLDSSSSFDTIQLLSTLANEGRTIVCTIHQPSSNIYNLFNQIYVLSSGHCTYQGTPQNTVAFLKTVGLDCPEYHNPADFLLECVNNDYGNYTAQLAESAKQARWHYDTPELEDEGVVAELSETQFVKMIEANTPQNIKPKQSLTPSELSRHTYPPPEWMRLWILIGRCHMQFFRDWTVTYLKLLVHIACGILIGLFFGDSGINATKQVSNISSAMIHCVYLWYTTIMPGVLRFPLEISIIKKETFNNWYKLRTYYLATLITSTPVHIMFSTVYITITYLLTDQPVEIDRFVKFLLTAVVITICADGLGILLGTALNPINGTFVGAIFTCFMLIFSGFLILLTHMPYALSFIAYLSPMRYALENMVLSLYGNNRENTICPPDTIYCHFKNAATVLKVFGMENGHFGFNIAMIMVQICVFKSLTYFTLKRKIKSV